MKRTFAILFFLLEIVHHSLRGQSKKPVRSGEKFINFLNHYQVDSLKTLMADNFQLNRTFASYSNDSKSFINDYIPTVKNFKGKFNIIRSTDRENGTEMLVEDKSDYFRYLRIPYPMWIIRISTDYQGKVDKMTIDTTKNYRVYLKEVAYKGNKFGNWLHSKYPNETTDSLNKREGLMIRRLREYADE